MHRLAVRRAGATLSRSAAPGLGAALLKWAGTGVRDGGAWTGVRGGGAWTGAGRPLLRLDCVATNRRLRDYYEAAGFAYRGDVAVGGAPGELVDRTAPGGHVTVVSRYERRLH